jgi:hypothetical protein
MKNLRRLKDLASNYLWFQYGALPTVSDLEQIWNAMKKKSPYLDKNGFRTLTSYHEDTFSPDPRLDPWAPKYVLEQHLKLAISKDDDLFTNLAIQMESLGVFPSLTNIWDLVPYSFVLDWFINIGDFLDRIDTRQRIERLNVKYVTMSTKKTTSFDLMRSPTPILGHLDLVQYHRWTVDRCPVPPLFVRSDPKTFNHWLEAGALIIQRIH